MRVLEALGPIARDQRLVEPLVNYQLALTRDARNAPPDPRLEYIDTIPFSQMPRGLSAPSEAARRAHRDVELAFRSVIAERWEIWQEGLGLDVHEGVTPFYRPGAVGSQSCTTISLGFVSVPVQALLAYSPQLRDDLRAISRDVVTLNVYPARNHADRVAELVTSIVVDGFERRAHGAPSFVGGSRDDGFPGFSVINGRHQLVAHMIAGEPELITEMRFDSYGLASDLRALSFLQRHQLMIPGVDGRLVAPVGLDPGL